MTITARCENCNTIIGSIPEAADVAQFGTNEYTTAALQVQLDLAGLRADVALLHTTKSPQTTHRIRYTATYDTFLYDEYFPPESVIYRSRS